MRHNVGTAIAEEALVGCEEGHLIMAARGLTRGEMALKMSPISQMRSEPARPGISHDPEALWVEQLPSSNQARFVEVAANRDVEHSERRCDMPLDVGEQTQHDVRVAVQCSRDEDADIGRGPPAGPC